MYIQPYNYRVFFKFRTPYINGLHLIPDTATHVPWLLLVLISQGVGSDTKLFSSIISAMGAIMSRIE